MAGWRSVGTWNGRRTDMTFTPATQYQRLAEPFYKPERLAPEAAL
jgi:hypothetical protein